MSADPLPVLNDEQQRKHATMVLCGWRFVNHGSTISSSARPLYEVRNEHDKHVTARFTLASAVDFAWLIMEGHVGG